MDASVVMPRMAELMPARIYLPILIVLGYVAFLITGFGTQLGAFQPVPVYIFFSLLLFTLQLAISETHTVARVSYVILTSGFAIVYAGERVFNSAQNFTRSPYTYIILNALLLIVFVYDALGRRRSRAAQSGTDGARPRPTTRLSYRALATEFAGGAILFYVAAFLLDVLGPQTLFQRLGIPRIGASSHYPGVDLNSALNLNLHTPINLLQNLDLAIALFATAISLLLLVIIGALVIPQSQQTGSVTYGRSLDAIITSALRQVSLSLRLVLGPLVLLIPAFSIAAFSQQITEYLRFSAQASWSTLLDLFNPLSKTSLAHVQQGLVTLGFGVLAVGMAVLAVIVMEQKGRIITRAFHIVEETGRVVSWTWAFFLYSLAALNAVVVLTGFTSVEPFQVGAPGLIALLVGVGFLIYGTIRAGAQSSVLAPVGVKTR
ncbi:MAG: hypothetical protein ACHQ4H_06175 [Ktedonobacterales bacterium]